MIQNIFFLQVFILIKEVFIFGLVGFFVAILVSPIAFLKTQKQETGFHYKKLFHYHKKNGYSVFYSGFFHYAILNAISSASFGFIEGVSIPIIKLILDPYSLFGIFLRTLLLGFFETILIIYFDYKTIQKQKIGLLDHEKLNLLSFFTPSFLKNTIIWFGTTFSIYIIYLFQKNFIQINYFQETLISFLFGLLFATISLPLDVICVKRVGSYNYHNKSMILILKQCIKNEGFRRIFAGGVFRVLLLAIFTISTVLTSLFLKK